MGRGAGSPGLLVARDLYAGMFVYAHRGKEQGQQTVRIDEADAALFGLFGQHPVQQVARGDEVDPNQARAGHLHPAARAELAVDLLQLDAEVAGQLT